MVSEETKDVQYETNETSLQKKYTDFQSFDEPATRKDLLSSGLIFFGIGIVTSIAGCILFYFGYRVGGYAGILVIIGIIVALGSFMLALYGAGRLMSTLLVRTKTIKCPYCRHESQILRKVAWIFCQNCKRFLMLSKNDNSYPNMINIECPYCNRLYASSDCVSTIVCDDCNLKFDLQKGDVVRCEKQSICKRCQNNVPENVFFCNDCDAILNEDFVDSFASLSDVKQWQKRVRRSPKGSFRYGSAILDKIDEFLNEARLQNGSLEESKSLLSGIQAVLESLEMAALEYGLHMKISEKLPSMDYTYAFILTKIAREIRIYGKAILLRKEDADFISKSGWIDVRENLLSRLRTSEKNKELSSVKKWHKNILFVKQKFKESATPQIVQLSYYEITDTNLFEEAKEINIDGYNLGMTLLGEA